MPPKKVKAVRHKLPEDQAKWCAKRRQGLCATRLEDLLRQQEGLCALSKVRLMFDKARGTPKKGGEGVHPLYAAVDHVEPGDSTGARQIVCFALNDVKGHLPSDCFKFVENCPPWKTLMEAWRKQAKKAPDDREAFRRLLRPNARPKD